MRLPRHLRIRNAWPRDLRPAGPGEAILTIGVGRSTVEIEINTSAVQALARMLWQHHDREVQRIRELAGVLRRPEQ